MKSILTIVIFLSLVVSGLAQTRNVVVGTNGAVVSPTNFWSADVTNARSGLGLGSAATNPASAFQPSSLVLSNLAISNGGSLTNLSASSVVGALSVAQGGTGSTNASDARTALGLGSSATNPASAFQSSSVNLSNLASNNGLSLTNVQASNIVGAISITSPVINFTNITGTLSLAQGGTSATNAANARQNLGSTTVGDALFIATTAAAARTTIGALSTSGDAINLTNFPSLLLRTNGNAAGLTNLTAANITGTIAVSNGGTGATNAGGARTNLGMGSTNTVQFFQVDAQTIYVDEGGNGIQFNGEPVVAATRANLGLGTTNNVSFGGVAVGGDLKISNGSLYWDTNLVFEVETATFETQVYFTEAAATRTNLGLGFSALTNTNTEGFNTSLYGSGTNPVLYNTNGEVVSPTNFWQVAPITTTFIESQPTTNQTTNIAAGRNLHIHSIAFSTVGITNTIALPTTGSFNGDIALVVHQGPTSSVTAVRTAGAGTNLITLNQFEEAVEFVYYNSVWQFNHNQSFVEPIFFSGTNASANAAASRTNLGLGATNDVVFKDGVFDYVEADDIFILDGGEIQFEDSGTIIFGSAAPSVRTNLGLGLPALTNTNNADFRTAIELGATNNVTFSNVVASGTLTATSTVTAKTNLVVEGFVDYTAARTNNTPTNTPNFAAHAAWIEVKVGTNSFFLPAYQ